MSTFSEFFYSCSIVVPDVESTEEKTQLIQKEMYERFCRMRRIAQRRWVILIDREVFGPFADELEAEEYIQEYAMGSDYDIMEMRQ